MIRILLLALFCLSLCACGGGSGSGPATPQTSAERIAAYQGLYSGTIEYLGGRNGGGGGTVSFFIDELGNITLLPSNELTLPSNNVGMPVGFGGQVDEFGKVHGTQQTIITVNNRPSQELIASWNGTIDVSNGGTFDSTCTYSGSANFVFRIYGAKAQLVAQAYTQTTTLQTGQTANLFNHSMTASGSKYPYIDAGHLDLTSSWAITSAPFGSVATLKDGYLPVYYEKTFTPDLQGTYIITLTVTDVAGNTASSDLILSVI